LDDVVYVFSRALVAHLADTTITLEDGIPKCLILRRKEQCLPHLVPTEDELAASQATILAQHKYAFHRLNDGRSCSLSRRYTNLIAWNDCH